jgi:endonuclease-3
VKSTGAERTKEILRVLKLRFPVPRISIRTVEPFKVLVRTIISQSTAETNTIRAYQNLSSRLPITPIGLREADVQEIEEALKVAGLHRKKSKVIKKVSEIILQRFNGCLDFVYSLPLDEARRKLMRLPGVGPKTADIVLLFSANRPTLPVDTHVERVSKRLGLVPPKADYEGIRGGLQAAYPPEEYFKVHMLFIVLGRKYCKAIKPLHASCPINELCPISENLDTA